MNLLPERFRVVVDTNVLLRGLVNMRSASGGVLALCDRRAVVLLLSKPVISEYRDVLAYPAMAERYPELTREKVEVALRRLRYFGDVVRAVNSRIDFPRDPKDEKFIELAIAGKATHIVTGDNDLLELRDAHTDAANRFRQRAPSIKGGTCGKLSPRI